MLDLARLDHVNYSFFLAGDAPVLWHVRRVEWREELSQPYELVVDLITDGELIPVQDLLGGGAELVMERMGLVHAAFGIIHRLEELGGDGVHHFVRVYLVPALQLLDQRVDTRVFQGQTVPEIVEAVLGEALAEYEREIDVASGLSQTYEARDYCVQFRESDFDFCARLLEEEGIAYYFEADEDKGCEKLILVDNNEAYVDTPILVGGEIPIITDRVDEAGTESLQGLELTLSQRQTKVATRAYNFKAPSALDEGEQGGADSLGRTRELYLFDERRQIVDDPVGDPRAESFDGTSVPQRELLAEHRLELAQRDTRTAVGSSNVMGLGAGRRFTLASHRRDELSGQTFLVTRVFHEGNAPDEEIGGAADGGPRYANHFECIPVEQRFVPSTFTPRPRVHGAQTATVMGPADDPSEDIHTDPHGRVKVRFHWDRLAPEDETASCWVRVAHSWAGSGWGSLFIPRVGMEVVVEFLDGNPDRPLVIGCVYNGEQTPPYALPDEKTKSTIKSDSSPGGGGFNELRFEDAKGSEEVFLHAQKDFNETVLNDHTTDVEANQTITVGADQSTTVTGNQTNTVKQDQTETITGNQTMTVEKNRVVTVIGSQSLTIKGSKSEGGVKGSKLDITGDWKADASNTIELQAPTHIKLTCGGSVLEMVPGKITLTAGGGAKLVLDANALMSSNAGSSAKLDGNAKISASTGASAEYTANATITGATSTVQSSSGGMVELTADAVLAGAKCTCEGSVGKLELASDADLSGTNVNSTAMAKNAVMGATVALN
ncbi:type VI secretion system tip protein VgrG [Pseudenhygromyxa sp. WMMC2535]|uniref:type VI secretion system Vgr family protein n=1 Tax=Pseudenhygromyxa sp. WMMC2535 TaxID=2712867 RepID=UPI0015954983|nr:type VI secretion system tip protein TssI/VgrG [Pseudenhygromyxa sp. WMMC2535]NVB42051.1 type VI secretion system tip protein VgrG [Pseudenhygromyxa sp. WMMC2535]